MSNGTLAELPSEKVPIDIKLPDNEPSIIVLLPYNKYLAGTLKGKWIYYAKEGDKEIKIPVSLYDDEELKLSSEGRKATILSRKTVRALRREILKISEPPGNYEGTVRMLRTLMRDHAVFRNNASEIPEEKNFIELMKKDEVLCKAYWTLRFALSRSEFEAVGRLKAWLKAGPENFTREDYVSRLWFSIMDLPDESASSELQALSFSSLELNYCALLGKFFSPLVIYNHVSGWLVLARFGRNSSSSFFVWLYLNHNLFSELRDRKHLSLQEIIYAVWADLETKQTMNELMNYKCFVSQERSTL